MFKYISHKLFIAKYIIFKFTKQSSKFIHSSLQNMILTISYFILQRKYSIAIGPVDYEFGGVINHIKAILRNSKHKITAIPTNKLFNYLKKHDLIKFHRNNLNTKHLSKFKIIHSHVEPWFIHLCKKLKKNHDFLWVHTYHAPYTSAWGHLEPWQHETNFALENVACHADVKISVSKWQAAYYKKNFDIDTVVIPNSVDVTKCDAANASRFISKYQLKNFILFAASIREVKNPIEFIKLSSKISDKTCVMIGDGLTKDNIQALIEIQIPPNLHILGSFTHIDLLDAIAACSVFVITSKREGLPTSLLEAMALKKPVVVSDVDGCLEVVDEEKYGYIYHLGNIDNLVEKTQLALEDKIIGEKARKRIETEYDWEVNIKKIDALYESWIRK